MKMKLRAHICWLMLLIAVLFCIGCGKEEATDVKTDELSVTEQPVQELADAESTSEEPVLEETEEEGIAFPFMLDSDRLELSSVFEYAGTNPDCEDVYAEDIGAIQLKNVSGQYLKSAKILVSLSNGEKLNFLVEDIPTGMDVLAFETKNQTYDDTVKVADVVVEAEYSSAEFEGAFSYSVSGSDITVENISGKGQNNIILYYHCTVDGMCFGGQSYELSLEFLDVGASATVSDTACYMGDVTLVNIVAE